MLRLVVLATALLAVVAKVEQPVTKLQIGIKVCDEIRSARSPFSWGS